MPPAGRPEGRHDGSDRNSHHDRIQGVIEEVSEVHHLSPATVKTHVARIFSKLQLRDRVQLVVLAYESGLVILGN